MTTLVKTVLGKVARHTKQILVGIAFITLVYLVGFFWFLSEIPDSSIATPLSADAIVVLTGGPERIDSGVALLGAGTGKRCEVAPRIHAAVCDHGWQRRSRPARD